MERVFPRITLITPSLNQGHFIERTIRSVLEQEYPNLEYIVADGGSTDLTQDILREFSGRLVWFSEKDNGQVDAINKGLVMSSGEILSYLNADDILLPGSLQRVADNFVQNPEALWFTGLCKIINHEDVEIRRAVTFYKNLWLRGLRLNLSNHSTLLLVNFISQPATFWRKSAMERIGTLDETLNYVMDYDYWLKLWEVQKPILIPHYLAGFRIQRSSKTTSLEHLQGYAAEELRMISRHTDSGPLLLIHRVNRALISYFYRLMNAPRR
jgi:glycosyltransferase involved in cell wall biosynthesis